MKRAFGFDPSTCDRCGTQMVVMALITAPTVVTYCAFVDHPLLIWSTRSV
jgi:hypothetical protein